MRKVKRAFTLIEILIVVVILGILAAIVIPQFTNASDDAMLSSVRSQLQTLRSQVELYKVQNQGVASLLVAQQWADLTGGDYIQQAPINPFNDATTVAAACAAGIGWAWDGSDLTACDPTDVEGDGDGVFTF